MQLFGRLEMAQRLLVKAEMICLCTQLDCFSQKLLWIFWNPHVPRNGSTWPLGGKPTTFVTNAKWQSLTLYKHQTHWVGPLEEIFEILLMLLWSLEKKVPGFKLWDRHQFNIPIFQHPFLSNIVLPSTFHSAEVPWPWWRTSILTRWSFVPCMLWT